LKEILYVTAIYTGTLIGAGFATGKEIQEFFKTPLSILIAFILFLFINLRLFTYINKNNIYTYSDLLDRKCPKLKNFVKNLSGVFSLLSFGIMCNGAGEALGFYGGGVLFSVICCIVFLFELKGITYLNIIATPLIVLGIFSIAIAKTTTFAQDSFEAIKYCSYNTLCCLPVIPSLNFYIKDVSSAKKTAIIISVTSAMLIFVVHYSLPEYICALPLLETAKNVNLSYIYYPALLLAMLTTAVSSGYGYMCCYKNRKCVSIVTLFVVSCVMMKLDFGILIKYVFGFFGVTSLLFLYFLVKKS
jgi:uncharacterized membrane protein YkvI